MRHTMDLIAKVKKNGDRDQTFFMRLCHGRGHFAALREKCLYQKNAEDDTSKNFKFIQKKIQNVVQLYVSV